MRHQSANGGDTNHRRKPMADRLQTGQQKRDISLEFPVESEIDPADFFGPEDFG
jgi:hypothetical protein